MKPISTIFYSVLAVALALSIASCATTKQTRGAEPSGFLKDYSQLKEGEKGQAQLVYINPSADFGAYDKIMLESVTVWRTEESDFSKVSEEDLKVLTDSLYWAVQLQLETDYEFVERPGPGVMRLRLAITEAKGSKVVMNAVTSIVPQTRLLSTLGGMATDTQVMVGKAGLEGEIRDSLSDKRLAAMVDERAGTKAIRSKFNGTWNDVKLVYDWWAERLKTRLSELRMK